MSEGQPAEEGSEDPSSLEAMVTTAGCGGEKCEELQQLLEQL